MRQFTFLLIISAGLSVNLLGCERDIKSGCQPVSETIFVNERFPSQIEQYSPDSMRVFTFEYDFTDSVSIETGSRIIAKGYVATGSNGFAGRLLVKAQPNEEIVIRAINGCAHFILKDGYKYLYINRLKNKNWTITYSNFGRGYI